MGFSCEESVYFPFIFWTLMALKCRALLPLGWETKGCCMAAGKAIRDRKGIQGWNNPEHSLANELGISKGEILNPTPQPPCRAHGSARVRDRHVEINLGASFFLGCLCGAGAVASCALSSTLKPVLSERFVNWNDLI